MFDYIIDIPPNATKATSAVLCIDASSFLYGDTLSNLNLATYEGYSVSTIAVTSTIGALAMCASASAIANYATTDRFEIIQLPNMYKTSITTGANRPASNAATGSLAANPTTGFACSAHNLAGRIQIINCNTSTVTVTTPSFLTSQNVYPVCNGPNNNFILGTGTGNIYEVNSSGTLVAGYSLPRTKNNGTSPAAYSVTSLSYDNATGYLAAATNRGVLYVLNHAASSVVETFPATTVTFPAATQILTISNSVSGSSLLCGSEASVAGGTVPIVQFQVGPKPKQSNQFYFTDGPTALPLAASISPNGLYAVLCSTNNNGSWQTRICRFKYPLTYEFVETRIQDPVGVDISGQIIRIRDLGVGNAFIDVDQTIGAGPIALPAAKNNPYIEIALNGLSSPNERWDVREFNA